MCRPATAFGSRGQQILVCIIGWVGIVATGFLAANLLLESSTTVGTAPRELCSRCNAESHETPQATPPCLPRRGAFLRLAAPIQTHAIRIEARDPCRNKWAYSLFAGISVRAPICDGVATTSAWRESGGRRLANSGGAKSEGMRR
jgi:hypothetical protein